MRKRKSEVVDRLLQQGRRWHACGLMSDARWREHELVCTQPPNPLLPEEVRAIRARDSLALDVFADLLNTTPRLLRRWELGFNRPKGPALRLLHLVRDRGVDVLFLAGR